MNKSVSSIVCCCCLVVLVLSCAWGRSPVSAHPTTSASTSTSNTTPTSSTATTNGDEKIHTDRVPKVIEYRAKTATVAYYEWKEVNEALDRRTTCTNHCFHGGVNGDTIHSPLMAYATARCTCRCPKWCKRTGAVCQLCHASDNPAVPRSKVLMLKTLEENFGP